MVDLEAQVQQSIVKREHDLLPNFPEQRWFQNHGHQHMRLLPQTPAPAASAVSLGGLPGR